MTGWAQIVAQLVLQSLVPLAAGALAAAIFTVLYSPRVEASDCRDQRDRNLANLMSVLSEASVLIDNDGRIVSMNAAAETMSGFCLDQVKGCPLEQVLQRSDLSTGETLQQPDPKAHGNTLPRWITLTGKNGAATKAVERTAVVHGEDGCPAGSVVVWSESASPAWAEQSLHKSEAEKNLLLNAMDQHVIYRDLDGRIRWANEAAARFAGIGRDDLPGRWCFELRQGTGQRCSGCPSEEALRTRTSADAVVSGAEGSQWRIRIHPLLDGSGEVLGLMEIADDVTEERRAADRLRESEERYRRLAESAHAVLWEYDIASDCWSYVAPQVQDILGWETRDWTNYAFWEQHIHPDDREWAREYCAHCTAKGEDHTFEYRFQRRDGTYAWLRDVVRVEMDDCKPAKLRGFMIDISDRKEAELALQDSEEYLRTTLNSIGDGVIATDASMGIVHMNPRAEALTGWRADEAQGLPVDQIFRIVDTQTKHRAVNPVQQALCAGQAVQLAHETSLVTKTGDMRHVADTAAPIRHADGTVTGAVLVFSDVSEQHEAAKRLRESEERFRLLAENAQDLIFRLRLRPRRCFEYVSPSAVTLTGYGPDAFYQNPDLMLDICHPGDRHKMEAVWSGDLPADKSITMRWTTRNGAVIWVEQRTSAFYKDGRLQSIDSVCRDVTHRKETEERLRYLSFHDSLTGLYNRAFFEEEIRRMDKKGLYPIGVVMLDVNGLKMVNDVFGHQSGDALLCTVSERLQQSVRQEDVVARWGGDELVVLMPETDRQETETAAKRIYHDCQETSSRPIPVSVAVGYGVKEEGEQETYSVLKEAEDMMYKRKLTESASTRSSIVRTLLQTLGSKSHETEEHAWRLQRTALALGSALGLSADELDRLSVLVALHDIGKITVPKDVLLKKGPLSDAEWEMVRRHPETGYRIAAATDEFAYVAGDVLAHHERWDGKGYPNGLAGKEIPLLARITAIVDAYDAMISERAYSRAMTHDEAVAELRSCAGTQFDPHLTDVFVAVLQKKSIDVPAHSREPRSDSPGR